MAADINRVILIGRLTKDAEMKYTPSGQAVCKISIAVNRTRKNGDQWVDEANFFDVVIWGRQGEAIAKYLEKGKAVAVDGELRQDRWQQDGQNRSKVEIVADNVQLLGGPPQGRSSQSGGSNNGPNQSGCSGDRYGDGSSNSSADDGYADDIPF